MKKIFVSHSSKDSIIINDFVECILIAGLKIDKSEIAYTSSEDMGVEPGESITDYIKNNIASSSVFLAMISNNYNSSQVCMQEIGHIRSLDKQNIQILLPGASYGMLPFGYQHIKAIEIDKKDSLKSLCKVIEKQLAIKELNESNCDKNIDLFIEKLNETLRIKKIATQGYKIQIEKINYLEQISEFNTELREICKTFELTNKNLNDIIVEPDKYNKEKFENLLKLNIENKTGGIRQFKNSLFNFIERTKVEQLEDNLTDDNILEISDVKSYLNLIEYTVEIVLKTKDSYVEYLLNNYTADERYRYIEIGKNKATPFDELALILSECWEKGNELYGVAV